MEQLDLAIAPLAACCVRVASLNGMQFCLADITSPTIAGEA